MQYPDLKFKNKKPAYVKFADDLNFFKLFKKIEQNFDYCYFLESLGMEQSRSRYSIIGFDPEVLISAKQQELRFNQSGKAKNFKVDNPYLELKKAIPNKIISKQYSGGLVGYLGYDCVNYFEKSLKVSLHPDFDQFMFGLYSDGLVYDKMTGEIFYFYFNQNRINLIKKISKQKRKSKPRLKVRFLGDTKTEKMHKKMVESAKDEIKKGNIFQGVLGFKSLFEFKGDKIKIYERLRKINPSPHMFYLKFFDKFIIGASPEMLFRLRDNEMETFPLAGTIKRGKDLKEDRKLARILLNDPKERAEHSMLIDLHRNDMGRVARFGSVKVRNIMDIKKFSHVSHISSEVTGTLAQNHNMFSALASNFPAGTLSGAPKIEAIRIIERLENEPRGPYGGAVGHFGFNKDCTFAIPIRSLFISGKYGYAQTAGGIVYDSKAKNEYLEIKNKLKAMTRVLETYR
ncbi:MAG: anthranilate synthase component I family protein [Candidatus Moranbacteria bacterium]|nr:anthranilate synthase component I family protein [Candidatus Moranbacteria bacterium]